MANEEVTNEIRKRKIIQEDVITPEIEETVELKNWNTAGRAR
jgi:hypothetical protein